MMRHRRFPGALPWLFLLSACFAAAAAPAVPVAETEHPFSWVRFLAPFHMVVLHFPIGVMATTAFLEIWSWRRPTVELRKVIQFTLTIAVLASIATMGFGLLRAEGGEYEPLTLAHHRGWGIAAGSVTLIAWGLHWLQLREPGRGAVVAFRLLLFISLLTLVVAGHHGGSLTHGTTYLTENAPSSIKNLLGDAPGNPLAVGAIGATAPEAIAVRALFERRCLSCHGPEKQKAKFRVDDRATLLKGGKSGLAAVVPGDPGKSNLIRVCTLPKDHDEAMPPEGNRSTRRN
jgi:uncharacterized membrane protein